MMLALFACRVLLSSRPSGLPFVTLMFVFCFSIRRDQVTEKMTRMEKTTKKEKMTTRARMTKKEKMTRKARTTRREKMIRMEKTTRMEKTEKRSRKTAVGLNG